MFIYKITPKIHQNAIYFLVEITSDYFSAGKLTDSLMQSYVTSCLLQQLLAEESEIIMIQCRLMFQWWSQVIYV